MDWVVIEYGEKTVWPPNVYRANDYDDAVRIAQDLFDEYIDADVNHFITYDNDMFLKEERWADIMFDEDEYVHINIVSLLERR